jgi:hypothetical protein
MSLREGWTTTPLNFGPLEGAEPRGGHEGPRRHARADADTTIIPWGW